MNLVMMLVFPTLWSPRKTSLYLANGVTVAIVVVKIVVEPTNERVSRGFQRWRFFTQMQIELAMFKLQAFLDR